MVSGSLNYVNKLYLTVHF